MTIFTRYCHLLITLSNNLDPDQADILSGPDRGPSCLTLYGLRQVGVEPMFFFALNLYMTFPHMTSVDKCFKQFGPRSGLTFCPEMIGVKTV